MKLRLWTVGALTAAIVIGSSVTVTARKNSRSVRVVEAAIARIENMDFQGFERLLASDASFDNVYSLPNTSGTFEGRDAVIANIREIAESFEQMEFVDERLYVVRGGKTVFVEARGNFTLKETGKPYQNTYVFAFEIDKGKISAIREYNNPLTIIQTFNIPFSQSVGSNTK